MPPSTIFRARRDARLGRRQRQQRPRLTRTELPVRDHVENRLGQIQQANRVAHVRAALADPIRDVVVAERKLAAQSRECAPLLNRIQFLAREVLHQRHFQRGAIVEVAHDDRHGSRPAVTRRAQAALAGDQLIARTVEVVGIADDAHDQRLDNSLALDRARQLGEPLRVEVLARLKLASRDSRRRTPS